MSIIKYCIAALTTVSCMVAAAQGGEYWLDNNYAERNVIGASPASVNISSLPAGLHWFTMRVKDDFGLWSPAMTKAFIIPHEMDNSTATTIQRREVWFDDNVAERQTIGEAPVMLDISSLPAGLHSLTIRVQDDLGLWSSQKTKFFIKPHEVVEDVELVRYCYWFDDDEANLVVCELPVSGKTVSGVISIDMSTVPSGQHTLYWMIGDSKGAWGRFDDEVNAMEFYNSRGDVNMDGKVSIGDVTSLINYLLTDNSEGIDLGAANCDLNSTVSIGDVTKLINYLLTGVW